MAKFTKSTRRSARTPFLASASVLLGVVAAIACADELPTETTIAMPIVAQYSEHTGTNGRSFDLGMSQEVTSTFTGDPDGVGTALITLNAGQRTICWSLTAANIALPATGAHIHYAPEGVAGPIAVPLTPPDAAGTASGCAQGVERDLIVDILSDPTAYYVNVHSTEFKPGAIRSQLR